MCFINKVYLIVYKITFTCLQKGIQVLVLGYLQNQKYQKYIVGELDHRQNSGGQKFEMRQWQGYASFKTCKGKSFPTSFQLLVVGQKSLSFCGLQIQHSNRRLSPHSLLSSCVCVFSFCYKNSMHIKLRGHPILV